MQGISPIAIKAEVAAKLFAEEISRSTLLGLQLHGRETFPVKVNVWRNHAFEPIASLTRPFFDFGGMDVRYQLSGYDDSFSFADHSEAGAEIIWLDNNRFNFGTPALEWTNWLELRLRALRKLSTAPIILATWSNNERFSHGALQDLADRLPGVYFADLQAACTDAGVPLIDPRTLALAGTLISSAAQPVIARQLACHWLPAVLLPPIKAIALDLDNTLHSGVLGEDGISGVKLTAGHVEFQRYMKSLRARGVFLALVSRNQRSDAEALFEQRTDYPLRWEDFSAIEVSWDDKAAAIERIAKSLRIAPDTIVFVDDNIGELASVAMHVPGVKLVHASQDANSTRQIIHYYPGLWRWKVDRNDEMRIYDLSANSEREVLAATAQNMGEYFRSLGATLTFRYNPEQQLRRLADLCGKTNQFNLALRRFNEAELAERMARTGACVASVQLADRLADSGVIATIIAQKFGTKLLVEEICISCRALGRRLEDTIIIHTLRQMPILRGCHEIAFSVRHGPRNQPALDWLARTLGIAGVPSDGIHTLPMETLMQFVPAEGVALVKE